jgi:hypothetical protein
MTGRETFPVVMSIPVVGPIGLSTAHMRSETGH